MIEQDRQFDDSERLVSERFRDDLRGLCEPMGSVRPEVDRAILGQARRRLAYRPLVLRLRWAAGIAAAAVILLAAVLYNPAATFRESQSATSPALAEGRADVDRNGRVDILDAFRLAKHIETHGPTDNKCDINGDGRVNQIDVDLVASAAVRLRKGV